MDHKKMLVIGALAAVNFFGPASAMAEDGLPQLQQQGSIAYLTGGIGTDEAAAIKKAASRYSLSLEFARHAKPKGEFLADVDVAIKDDKDNDVLKVVSDGPFLLAKLPPGKYTVMAKANGQIKTMKTTITAGKPEHLVFVW